MSSMANVKTKLSVYQKKNKNKIKYEELKWKN